MKIGAQIGIMQTHSLQEAIAKVGKMGLRGIEVFEQHIVGHFSAPEVFAGWLQDAGVELSGVYFNSDKFIDPNGETEVVQKAEAACSFMKQVGCQFLVMNGGVGRGQRESFSKAEFEQMARVANRVAEKAKSIGINVVLHPHFNCMVETTADVDALLEAGLNKDLVGLCVHASHQLLKGVDPYQMYEKHAGWIRYVHIGDNAQDADKISYVGALIGEGVLDQKRLMKPLLNAGYDGWIIIESGKEGISPEEYCNKARQYLQTQWTEINWE